MIAGLDVGGAHLKVALVDGGVPVAVEQFACPLWQGIGKLDAALLAARRLIDRADHIAITMTGELSDLFDTRHEGVETLAEWLAWELGEGVRFWAGPHGFLDCEAAVAHHDDVGSTNFLASAELVARRSADAVLLDLGSTTADIIPVVRGSIAAVGTTDGVRQQTGELIYTGYTRTAVMGITQSAPFKGVMTSLAREYLATMADVHRILGELDEAVDQQATADGRGKSHEESLARLARMFGRDAAEGTLQDWQMSARHIASVQMHSLEAGLLQVLSRHPALFGERLVTAGIGADVANALAFRVGLQPITFGALTGAPQHVERQVTNAAPAVAVALLLASG